MRILLLREYIIYTEPVKIHLIRYGAVVVAGLLEEVRQTLILHEFKGARKGKAQEELSKTKILQKIIHKADFLVL